MILYIGVLLGSFMSLLLGLNEALVKPEWDVRVFFRQNLGSTLLNIICGCVLVYAKDEIHDIYPLTFMSSVVLGTSGQFLFKKVTKIFDSSDDTLIGRNKDKKQPNQ